ncbi:MAG: hypothetical protein ABMB14_03845 [Myxococcota bacterium]
MRDSNAGHGPTRLAPGDRWPGRAWEQLSNLGSMMAVLAVIPGPVVLGWLADPRGIAAGLGLVALGVAAVTRGGADRCPG